jgi:DNA polymerase III delta subunit
MPDARTLDDLLAGEARPLYLVHGDLVVAEPQAARLAEALAAKAGCRVERHRRPPNLARILADLRTYSLFSPAKVVLVVDSALLADAAGAAELIDQAAEALPLGAGADAENDAGLREAASRLLQALRVFGVDPAACAPEDLVESLPKWALQGGRSYRKKHSKARPAKDLKALAAGLAALLAAALEAGLKGFAEGDLAELGEIVSKGLPEGHSLVLVESAAAKDHPIRLSLERAGATLALGKVSAGRGGDWQGLAPLVEELTRELGVKIAPDAVAELARRTLRQSGSFGARQVDAESTSRFAAEFRKLASLARDGRVTRQLVAQSVEDRGEQDVWKILDAVGAGRGAEALALLKRYLAAADDVVSARLSFFAVLVRFCRQLVAVAGLVKLHEVPWGERNYNRFKDRLAPVLQGELREGGTNPIAGAHPFQVFRAYQTAGTLPGESIALLPGWVLDTELRLKGESSDADTALFELVSRLVSLVRR